MHPSLLPAFPGRDAQRQALEHGVKVSGATVHLVRRRRSTRARSSCRRRCRWSEDDTVERLSARILEAEHRIYPRAVRLVLEGRYALEGRRVRLDAGA